MLIKGITDEDFVNYRKTSMFIASSSCTFKCEKESGVCCCQNSSLAKKEGLDVDVDAIIRRYLKNPLTKSIVFGGLEPFDQFEDVFAFISKMRGEYHCSDTVVIYTGYNKDEIAREVNALQALPNIVVKFGRFIPNQTKHYDEVLGVDLASDNQYAEVIS